MTDNTAILDRLIHLVDQAHTHSGQALDKLADTASILAEAKDLLGDIEIRDDNEEVAHAVRGSVHHLHSVVSLAHRLLNTLHTPTPG